VGGVIAAALALEFVRDSGWEVLFALGMLPLVTLVPLVWKFLPESPAYLRARGRHAEADAITTAYGLEPPALHAAPSEDLHGRQAIRSLVARRNLMATVAFAGASFFGLLLVYGLNTWLPQIMRLAGYDLGPALTFLLVLNGGAVLGTALAALLADRVGSKHVVIATFLAATTTIALLAAQPSGAAIYALLAVAGLGTIGTQILINAYMGSYYAPATRATALGYLTGFGRLGAIVGPTVGGLIIDSGADVDWNFYAFAAAGLLGALLISFVPGRHAPAAAPAAGAHHARPVRAARLTSQRLGTDEVAPR
jgi:AAHS family benzoate transporter-like MFS transporter